MRPLGLLPRKFLHSDLPLASRRGAAEPLDGTKATPKRLPASYGPEIASYRSEEHTSELQSLMRISYAVFCLKKKKQQKHNKNTSQYIYTNTNTRQHAHNQS